MQSVQLTPERKQQTLQEELRAARSEQQAMAARKRNADPARGITGNNQELEASAASNIPEFDAERNSGLERERLINEHERDMAQLAARRVAEKGRAVENLEKKYQKIVSEILSVMSPGRFPAPPPAACTKPITEPQPWPSPCRKNPLSIRISTRTNATGTVSMRFLLCWSPV